MLEDDEEKRPDSFIGKAREPQRPRLVFPPTLDLPLDTLKTPAPAKVSGRSPRFTNREQQERIQTILNSARTHVNGSSSFSESGE